MGAAIGQSMAALGVHQGLAPVLDVVRDVRWGRVDECIGEDPYLVGTLGTSYVRGLQSAGVLATLKHFVGYSASRAGRNLAPVSAGPREVADVLLPPFEMAVRDGGVRSVMHSYAEIDGVPVAADRALLTELLRDRWGFDGTVVADYFGVAFLHTLHHVAGDLGEAAGLALEAGVDIELPTGNAYLAPLEAALQAGTVPVALLDQAVVRVLRQKEELGLLDAAALGTFDDDGRDDEVDLDPAAHRALAGRLAERSVVLLTNDGVLPLAAPPTVAVVGPNADRLEALFGCYSFVNHVLGHHPGYETGIEVPTVLEALRAELAGSRDHVRPGQRRLRRGPLDDPGRRRGRRRGVGRRGGRGRPRRRCSAGARWGRAATSTTSSCPACSASSSRPCWPPARPVVLVMLTGRPYAVDWAVERCAAVVQSFFPGEEGAAALAGVLSGRVNPSGRLPVSMPRSGGAQPYSYLHPALGGASSVTNVPTAPVLPFGHGLSYTTLRVLRPGAGLAAGARGRRDRGRGDRANTGDRAGAEVVQLYGHDVVGSVTRPVAQLLAYARVELEAGARARLRLRVPTARLAFSDRTMTRVVEPGAVELWVGRSCEDRLLEAEVAAGRRAAPADARSARAGPGSRSSTRAEARRPARATGPPTPPGTGRGRGSTAPPLHRTAAQRAAAARPARPVSVPPAGSVGSVGSGGGRAAGVRIALLHPPLLSPVVWRRARAAAARGGPRGARARARLDRRGPLVGAGPRRGGRAGGRRRRGPRALRGRRAAARGRGPAPVGAGGRARRRRAPPGHGRADAAGAAPGRRGRARARRRAAAVDGLVGQRGAGRAACPTTADRAALEAAAPRLGPGFFDVGVPVPDAWEPPVRGYLRLERRLRRRGPRGGGAGVDRVVRLDGQHLDLLARPARSPRPCCGCSPPPDLTREGRARGRTRPPTLGGLRSWGRSRDRSRSQTPPDAREARHPAVGCRASGGRARSAARTRGGGQEVRGPRVTGPPCTTRSVEADDVPAADAAVSTWRPRSAPAGTVTVAVAEPSAPTTTSPRSVRRALAAARGPARPCCRRGSRTGRLHRPSRPRGRAVGDRHHRVGLGLGLRLGVDDRAAATSWATPQRAVLW